jgi:hyperosmotically inducible protein
MKSIKPRIPVLTLACLLGAAASASALAAPTAGNGFAHYDSNGDGKISPEEFRAQGGQEQAFRAADANHDNSLNPGEFIASVADNDRVQAGKYVDDAWITAKARASLLKDEGVKGLDVNVETRHGTVLLSGWVKNPAQIARAEQIVRGIEGVKDVKNALQIEH